MNFFDAQARSHTRSKRLIFVMALAVAAVVASVVFIVTAAVWLAGGLNGASGYRSFLTVNSTLALWTAAGTLLLIAIASLFRIATLRQGGGKVARELGGTLVSPGDTDRLRVRLRNVVEEMAIASGVPTPEIYVLDHESGINAFAAGFTPEDAAIAVTRGTLEILNRDELQAVIAHEFSHIFNGDMRLNIQLMGPMFGILAIGLLGRILLRNSRVAGAHRSRNSGVGLALLLGAGLAVIGYVGLLLARLIKAGVSRQREYLADASAVQFTRQSSGIAGALKKIAGYREQSSIHANSGEEVSHMLFASGFRSVSGLLATHPPLFERIRAVEPGFTKAQFDALQTRPDQLAASQAPAATLNGDVQGFAPQRGRVSVNELLDTVGHPNESHYAAAQYFVRRIPQAIAAALESPYQVVLLLLAMMLHANRAQRTRQLGYLQQQLGTARLEHIETLYSSLQSMQGEPRLALLNLALPLLRQQPATRLQYLEKVLEELAMQDQELELFEFMLLRVLRSYIRQVYNPGKARNWQALRDPAMRSAAATLLAAFTKTTNSYPPAGNGAADQSFAAQGKHAAAASSTASIKAIDSALLKLEDCLPHDREQVVAALMKAALHDGHISQPESELLRAICAILDCPLPPVLAATWQ
jgi:Zn-dependent protease with chaperone function